MVSFCGMCVFVRKWESTTSNVPTYINNFTTAVNIYINYISSINIHQLNTIHNKQSFRLLLLPHFVTICCVPIDKMETLSTLLSLFNQYFSAAGTNISLQWEPIFLCSGT